MTPLKRRLAVAAGTAAVVALAGCGPSSGGGGPGPTASASGSGTPSATATTPAAPRLTGTLFYLGIGTHGGLYTVNSTTVTTVVPDTSFMFFQSASVSQDGHKVAYVLGDQAGSTGQVRVLTLGGGATTIGPSTVTNLAVPQWTTDGSAVYVGYGSGGQQGLLNVTTGALTALSSASGCCFSIRSPDGGYAIVRSATTISITRADGSSPVPGVAPAGQVWNRLQSLSPDGHHVTGLLKAVGQPGGDAGRVVGANAIADLTTGTVLPVPGGGTLREAWYQADGTLVIRVVSGSSRVVRLVSAGGDVLDEITEPAAAADLELIAYAR